MEGHRRDLEGETGKHEDQAEHQAELAVGAGQRRGDLLEAGAAGIAVDERDAVEQHAGRQRAEHEIFEAGFGGTQIVAIDRGHDVERQRLQLEPEIKRDHAVGRDHQHHAERRQQHQHRIFELVELLLLGEFPRHDQRHRGADQRQHLHEARERIADEGIAEGVAVAAGIDHHKARHDQHQHRQPGNERGWRPRRDKRRASTAPARRQPRSARGWQARGSKRGPGSFRQPCQFAAAVLAASSETVMLLTSASTDAAVASNTGAG